MKDFNIDVYLRDGEIIIFPVSKTVGGYSYTETPSERLSVFSEPKEIGEKILKSIEKVRFDRRDEDDELFLEEFPENSWNVFIKKVSYCSILRKNGKPMKVKPAYRRGNSFEYDNSTLVDIENSKEIGEKVLEALNKYPPR